MSPSFQPAITIAPTARTDAYELLNNDPDPAEVRRLADANDGRIIHVRETGRRFRSTIVNGRSKHTVEIDYSPLHGWKAVCACGDNDFCLHAMTLLHRLLQMSILDNPDRPSSGSAAMTKAPAPDEAPGTLVQLVASRMTRPLEPAETRLLDAVATLHEQYFLGHNVNVMHLARFGVQIPTQTLPPWTSLSNLNLPPSNDPAVWWGDLLAALAPHKIQAPEVLLVLADMPAAQQRRQQWQRTQEINDWRTRLQRLALFPPGEKADDPFPVSDLRLCVCTDGTIHLEGQTTGTDLYRPLSGKITRRLFERGAPATWPPEALLLWSLMSSPYLHHSLSYSPKVPLENDATHKLLVNALQHPALTSRFVSEEGAVLTRPEGTLRWELLPPKTSDADYTLRLLTPGGKPLPTVLVTLSAGRTAYYLTETAIYQGPHPADLLTRTATTHTIPAPALETVEGAQCLHALGAPLPPRLAERVRQESIPTIIRCSLHPGTATTELCQFHLSASSADGLWQALLVGKNDSWRITEKTITTGQKPMRDPAAPILLYDHSSLATALSFVNQLEPRWSNELGNLAIRVTKNFPERFAAWARHPPPNVQIMLEGDLATLTGTAVAGACRLEVSEHDLDWFDLRVVVDVQDATLTPEEIRLLLAAHGNFVRLPEKGWRRLAFTLAPEEEDALARMGLNPRDFDAEPQRLHALQLADGAARRMLPEEQAARVARRAEEIRLRSAPDVPAGITAELRPYQLEGFHFLAYLAENRFGGILADDMGLGKTLQALTWLVWLRAGAGKKPPPALIVCPKSVTDNWLAEAARFAPALRVRVWQRNEAVHGLTKSSAADLHVINYHQLRLAEESAERVEWLAVVLDEGQQIKNPSSQAAQIARRLRARHRLVLTGTPIENQLLDLWSLFAFAMPGVLGHRAQFGRTFDAKGDPNARRRLSARVRPFLLRRTKAQVAADLPPRVEEDLVCEMEGAQLALYQAERKRARQMLLRIETDQQLADQRFHILVSLLRLRQICCHPALIHPEADPGESAKLDALLDLLEPLMEEGHKVLVFSQFVEVLALIRRALEARGWKHFLLTGETEDRGDLVQSFKDSRDPAVFLISLRAGGSGLNLAEASYVVLFDPWWNPAVENQAIDRTHRIGQTRTVNAYRLLVKGTVEEKIRKLQQQKKCLAEDVLGEERFAQSLTLNDLQFLFDD